MNIAKTKNSRERWNGTDKKGTTVKVGQLIFNNRIIGRITKIKGCKVTARRIHWNESAPVETASWTMPADVSVLDDSDKLKLPAGKNTVPPSIHFTRARPSPGDIKVQTALWLHTCRMANQIAKSHGHKRLLIVPRPDRKGVEATCLECGMMFHLTVERQGDKIAGKIVCEPGMGPCRRQDSKLSWERRLRFAPLLPTLRDSRKAKKARRK